MSNEKYSTTRLKHLFLAPCFVGHNQVNHKEIKEKNKGFNFCKTDKKQAETFIYHEKVRVFYNLLN